MLPEDGSIPEKVFVLTYSGHKWDVPVYAAVWRFFLRAA